VLTLYPEGDPQPEVACTVAVPYLSPTAVESIANIVLFMPVAVLAGVVAVAALAWHRYRAASARAGRVID